MAKIPDIQTLGGRPTPSGIGAARLPAPALGGGIGAGGSNLAEIGSALGNIGNFLYEEQEKDNKLYAESALNDLKSIQMDLTMGEKGFTHKKSKDAVTGKLMDDYSEQLESAIDEISSNLENDRQRELFERRADITRLQYKQDMLNHLTREKEVFAKETFQSGIKVEVESVGERWQDKNGVKLSINRMEALIKAEADREGWSKDKKKDVLLTAQSEAHKMVITQALASENYDYAKNWFDKNKKQISSADEIKINTALKSAGMRQRTQSAVDIITEKGLSETEALSYARKHYKGEEEDEIVRRLKVRYGEANKAEKEGQKDALEQYVSIWGEMRDFDAIFRSYPEVIEQMNPADVTKMRLQDEKFKQGIKTPSGGGDYYALKAIQYQDAINGTDKFKEINLNAADLSDSDRKTLINEQTKVSTATLTTKSQALAIAADKQGLKYKNLATDEKVQEFVGRIESELKASGLDATPSNIEKISDRLAIERKRSFWFDTTIYKTEIEGVPTEMLDELALALQKAGKPVTEDNLIKLYQYVTSKQ